MVITDIWSVCTLTVWTVKNGLFQLGAKNIQQHASNQIVYAVVVKELSSILTIKIFSATWYQIFIYNSCCKAQVNSTSESSNAQMQVQLREKWKKM